MAKPSSDLHSKLTHIVAQHGNTTCADCGATGPTWASFSLGIFVCLECAGIHRSLGTHVSRVRSITLDTWDAASVQTMAKVGNQQFNAVWEAQLPVGAKPPPDANMRTREAFIRAKYTQRKFKLAHPRASEAAPSHHIPQKTGLPARFRSSQTSTQGRQSNLRDGRCEELRKTSPPSSPGMFAGGCFPLQCD